MKLLTSLLKPVLVVTLCGGLSVAGYFTRDYWLPLVQPDTPAAVDESTSTTTNGEAADAVKKIVLADQAITNLHLSAKPVAPTTYWKAIQVPGMVVDRPGRSDRGVITPVTGVVTAIHYFPGDTVRPGENLFTIRLLSESLHATQSDLFKATQDITLAVAQRKRLQAAGGAIPEARIVEVDNQITRLEVAVKAYRRELSNRGLVAQQIDDAAQGNFVSEIAVLVPSPSTEAAPLTSAAVGNQPGSGLPALRPVGNGQAKPDLIQTGGRPNGPNGLPEPTFEVEELKVDIGHQVQAGQTLCLLANHQSLAIEGRAFRDETPLLERSVQEGWPVEVDFQENPGVDWPRIEQTFHIRHIANNIDSVNRTFAFRIPLENQSRLVNTQGSTQMLWRFRPGQKVRVQVRVEKLDNVFVLPADAVTRDLAEAFVFTQNVNTFERRPVRVLAEDRRHTVVANDGSLLAGSFVVQNAAAQLNRMTKSQSSSGLPEGYHIHADGSLHKNEDEAK
jgi:biotin carboxyl carrier protein